MEEGCDLHLLLHLLGHVHDEGWAVSLRVEGRCSGVWLGRGVVGKVGEEPDLRGWRGGFESVVGEEKGGERK